MFLETSVVPVCRFEIHPVKMVIIKEMYGTVFFINNSGIFITAAHVINDCVEAIKLYGGTIGLCVKGENGKSPANFMAPVIGWELAASPYDIAIGKVGFYGCETHLKLADIKIDVWKDVATYGYPSTIEVIDKALDSYQINLRAHKGYIQRLITTENKVFNGVNGDIHPSSFETNFTMNRGLSGAPLFVNGDTVVGVCVGNISCEYRGDIDNYGIAHDMRPLLSWQPKILGNKTLLEVSSENTKPVC